MRVLRFVAVAPVTRHCALSTASVSWRRPRAVVWSFYRYRLVGRLTQIIVGFLQSLQALPKVAGLVRGTPEFERVAEELLQEARQLHSLRHPNILLLHGVTMHPEYGHVQWLVTELAEGGSLEAWVTARGRVMLEELLDLLRSVMRALVYLHSRMPVVLHCGIKPSNVLVFTSPDGSITWKLGDVGIAKVVQSMQHARRSHGVLHSCRHLHGPVRR